MMARNDRRRRRFATLVVALLLFTLLPGRPTGAQGLIDQDLDNAQAEFVRGSFLGTAVSPEPLSGVTPKVPNDLGGAVQLAPLGLLNPWPIGGNLPEALASHGVAAIGNRLYTVAGVVGAGQSTTSAVYWSVIDQVTGRPTAHNIPANDPRYVSSTWLNDPLSRSVGSGLNGCAELATDGVEGRSNPAVAAVDNLDGSGYLYVIGGATQFACANDEILTTPLVQIGTVAADGQITWTSGSEGTSSFLPSPLLADDTPTSILPQRLGIESAQAVTVRTNGGKIFLYVIGGDGIFPLGLQPGRTRQTFATPAVFYTEIDPANGRLRHPATGAANAPWARTANVPVEPPPGQSGLYGIFEHTATAARAFNGTSFGSTIYVAGGYIQPAGAQAQLSRTFRNPYVFAATVNETTGALEWRARPSRAGVFVATEGDPVASLASLAYNNKLYLIAGTTSASNANALNSVITGGYDSDFYFQPLLGSSDFFVGRQQTSPVLATGLIDSGSAVIGALPPEGTPTELNSAWSYVVGGTKPNGDLSSAIYIGALGGSAEASGGVRARDGWYYSQFYDVSIARSGQTNSAARVLKIRWGADIDRGSAGNRNADIIIEFRKVNRSDLRCDEGAFEGAPWLTLDGDTASNFYSAPASAARPLNEVPLGTGDFIATCFQYRARLLQNGLTDGVPAAPENASASPKLLKISLQKTLPGTPDLRLVEESDFSVSVIDGQFANLTLKVSNLNTEGINQTQDADTFLGGQTHALLCVSYNKDDVPPDPTFPTLPLAEGSRAECAPVYALLNRSALKAGVSVTLGRLSEWLRNTDPGIDGAYGDLAQLFSETGYYKVGVVIDPFNYIEEGATGEANNLAQFNDTPLIRSFLITAPPLPPDEADAVKVYLPAIAR